MQRLSGTDRCPFSWPSASICSLPAVLGRFTAHCRPWPQPERPCYPLGGSPCPPRPPRVCDLPPPTPCYLSHLPSPPALLPGPRHRGAQWWAPSLALLLIPDCLPGCPLPGGRSPRWPTHRCGPSTQTCVGAAQSASVGGRKSHSFAGTRTHCSWSRPQDSQLIVAPRTSVSQAQLVPPAEHPLSLNWVRVPALGDPKLTHSKCSVWQGRKSPQGTGASGGLSGPSGWQPERSP